MTPHARDPDQPGRRTHPLARAILTRATRRLSPARQPWGAAMLAELDHIDGRFEAITWALGSLRVAWRERGRRVSAAATAAARLRRPAPGPVTLAVITAVTAVYLAKLLIRFVPIGGSVEWASATSTGVVDSGQRPLSWNLPGLTCLILLLLTAVLGLAAALALLRRRAGLARRLLGAAAITGTVPMVLPGLLAVTARTWVSRMQQSAPDPPTAAPDSAGRRAMRQAPATMLLLLCLVLVVTAIAAAAVWRTTRQGVTPRWVHGTINNVDSSGTRLGLREDGSADITGYALGPVGWTDANGVWHSGDHPACLAPGSHGQRVELGLIDYRPTAAADGGTVVVWVRCL